MSHARPYKIALNGYGRIGRCVLRALHERGDLDVLFLGQGFGDIQGLGNLRQLFAERGHLVRR